MQGIIGSLEVAHGVKVMKLKQLRALEQLFGRLETAEAACAKLLTTWKKRMKGLPVFDEARIIFTYDIQEKRGDVTR